MLWDATFPKFDRQIVAVPCTHWKQPLKKKVNKESSLSWTDAMWVIKISTPGCYGSLKIWDQQKHIRWCCKIVVSRMCEYLLFFFSGFWSFCSLSSVPGLQGFLHNDAWAEENPNRPFPLKIISLIEFCGTPKKYIKKCSTWTLVLDLSEMNSINSYHEFWTMEIVYTVSGEFHHRWNWGLRRGSHVGTGSLPPVSKTWNQGGEVHHSK